MKMADNKLLNGVMLFKPKDTAPDFVLASGVITPDDLMAFVIDNPDMMTEYNGKKQLRIQVLRSKEGKPYIAVDTWKPNAEGAAPQTGMGAPELPDDSKLPF